MLELHFLNEYIQDHALHVMKMPSWLRVVVPPFLRKAILSFIVEPPLPNLMRDDYHTSSSSPSAMIRVLFGWGVADSLWIEECFPYSMTSLTRYGR